MYYRRSSRKQLLRLQLAGPLAPSWLRCFSWPLVEKDGAFVTFVSCKRFRTSACWSFQDLPSVVGAPANRLFTLTSALFCKEARFLVMKLHAQSQNFFLEENSRRFANVQKVGIIIYIMDHLKLDISALEKFMHWAQLF